MLTVAKARSTYHVANRKCLSQRLRRACRKLRRRFRSRRRSSRRSNRLGCLDSLFNAYPSLENYAFSDDILHPLPYRSPPGWEVVEHHRSHCEAGSSPKARAMQPTTLGKRNARAFRRGRRGHSDGSRWSGASALKAHYTLTKYM